MMLFVSREKSDVMDLDTTKDCGMHSGFEANRNVTDTGSPKSGGTRASVEIPDFVMLHSSNSGWLFRSHSFP